EPSTSQEVDTITFTNAEATNATYFIGVHLQSGAVSSANYTLSTETNYLTTLAWESGATHGGTQDLTNNSPTGGDYFFKITAQSTTVGAWRTALKVISGEADIYLKKDTFATTPSSYNAKSSAHTGSDGIVLAAPEFSNGQDFYILVRAT